MRSKILAALSALAIALGMVAFTTMSASAHTPNVDATCTTLSVSLTNYNGQANKTNTVTVTIDGSVVDSNSNFGTTFVKSYTFSDKTVAHTWKVDYTAWDDVNGNNHWTGSKSGTTTPCVATDATAAISFTPPTCDTAQGLVLGATTNATWGAITYSGAGNMDFSVTATATGNHLFDNTDDATGKTKTFTGTLLGATGNCTPPPTCITAVWSMPTWINSTTPSWPQTLYTSFSTACGNLTWTPPEGCGLQFQIDSYYDDDTTRSLLAGGTLYGPHNPGESLVPGGWGVAYKLVKSATDCTTAPAATMIPAACAAPGLLSLTGEHVTFTVVQGNDPKGTFTGIAPGNYTVYNTWGDMSSGPYYGPVTVTAQLESGYSVSGVGAFIPLTANTAAPSSLRFDTAGGLGPWNLISAAPQDCPTVVNVVPEVTFTDVCGTTNDTVNVPSQTGVTYTTVDSRVNGVGDVTVTATPSSTAYVFADTVTTTSWTFTFTNASCGEVKYLEPSAVDPTCPQEPDANSGYILLDLQDHLHYTINTVPTTLAKNDRVPGTYTIGVTVDDGYTLVGPSSWELVVNEPFCPPTLALLSTTASMSNLTCSTAGSFTLANTEGIEWFVNGSTTATPAGTYPRSTPGVVNVEAKLVDPVNDGWEAGAQKTWSFPFTTPVDCLPTLAFTGSNGGNLGLLLSGGLLLFGGTIIAFERRFRSQAQ